MIIFQSDRVLSGEQADIFRHHFQAARDSGGPFILPPGWTWEDVAVPTISGPLVDYLAQLGDA